jgi:hypothetical protein
VRIVNPTPDPLDQLVAYADVQATPNSADIDWSDEFDRIAEQTLGGCLTA